MTKVDWYGEEVRLWARGVAMSGLVGIGHQIIGHAKVNITNNDQVDTGFMRESGYVSAPGEDNYGAAKSKALGKNRVGNMGSKIEPPNQDTVIAAFGAEYAIHQERQKSFLYRALEQVQGEVAELEVERVARNNHG